jgi:hypothetical protein
MVDRPRKDISETIHRLIHLVLLFILRSSERFRLDHDMGAQVISVARLDREPSTSNLFPGG